MGKAENTDVEARAVRLLKDALAPATMAPLTALEIDGDGSFWLQDPAEPGRLEPGWWPAPEPAIPMDTELGTTGP